VDDGLRMDAAIRIVSLEYQLAAAQMMIEVLRRKADDDR
jgi:MerR family transcriptional regulator, heat shock protein HspR